MFELDELRVAWWNTNLSPLPHHEEPRHNSHGRWEVACGVVRGLARDEQVDLLVLGEVMPEDVDRLRDNVREHIAYETIVDDRSRERRSDLALLYNPTRLRVACRLDPVSETFGKEPASAVFPVGFVAVDGAVLWVFAVHWRSQRQTAGEHHRAEAAMELRRLIARLRGQGSPQLGIVLGDFNDEPGSASVERHLRASRERALARAEPSMLYNPTWRLLGERLPYTPESNPRSVAGTHHFRDAEPATRWYTYDQLIVTPDLVQHDAPWNLAEDSLHIWWEEALFVPSGGLGRGFDHLPIVATLRRSPGSTSQGDRP